MPMSKKILHSIAVLFFGIVLGTVSKFLDTTPSNELPFIIERLDVRNFLGRFAIWILIAVCISIYSNSSIRAAVNVFTFFLGMGYKLLFVFNVYRRIFPKKLCNDLVWAYSDFSPVGFCMLVCERKKQNFSGDFFADYRCFIQYDICIRLDIFRHLLQFRIDRFYLRIGNFEAQHNQRNDCHNSNRCYSCNDSQHDPSVLLGIKLHLTTKYLADLPAVPLSRKSFLVSCSIIFLDV